MRSGKFSTKFSSVIVQRACVSGGAIDNCAHGHIHTEIHPLDAFTTQPMFTNHHLGPRGYFNYCCGNKNTTCPGEGLYFSKRCRQQILSKIIQSIMEHNEGKLKKHHRHRMRCYYSAWDSQVKPLKEVFFSRDLNKWGDKTMEGWKKEEPKRGKTKYKGPGGGGEFAPPL